MNFHLQESVLFSNFMEIQISDCYTSKGMEARKHERTHKLTVIAVLRTRELWIKKLMKMTVFWEYGVRVVCRG